ncbi:MAG TPA: ABC transporter permease subunit [Pyrinomonadaceae bacterium]|nr:ABC transporter permease subunit [Pyrinomonadaceae bacterium]
MNASKVRRHAGRLAVVRAIAARELREHLLGTRFRLISATTLILVALSTLAGIFNYRLQVEQYQTGIARGEQKLHEATTWSEVQPLLVRPTAPLMILNAGFETREGRIAIASNSQIPAKTEDGPVGTPYLARFGEFDVTTVVVYLLGLLAVLLSFDAVSGEKERGTLALAFSNPLSRGQVLAGKYLGGILALALALVASLLTALLVWVVSGVPFPGEAWPRIGLWLLALLLYLSAMLWIGLLVSVFTGRASSSLLVAMLAWFTLVIFIPVAAAFASRQLVSPPSSYTLSKEISSLDKELEGKSLELKKSLGPQPESEGFAISLEQGVSMNFYTLEAYQWWLRYYEERVRLEREYALKVYQTTREFQEKNRAQAEEAFLLSALSPAAHLERVSNQLTGTSRDDTYYFFEAARRYQQRLIDFYDANHLTTSLSWISDDPPNTESPFPKASALEKGGAGEETKATLELGRKLYAQVLDERASGKRSLPVNTIPRFDYSPQGIGRGIRRVSASIAALLLINLLCAAVTYWKFGRYDVRISAAGE